MTRPKITRDRLRVVAFGVATVLSLAIVFFAIVRGWDVVALAYVLGGLCALMLFQALAAIDEWDAHRRLSETQERVMREVERMSRREKARAAAVADARHRESARWN